MILMIDIQYWKARIYSKGEGATGEMEYLLNIRGKNQKLKNQSI